MRQLSLMVYDDSADTAEVLAAVFEPQGISVQRRRQRVSLGTPGPRTSIEIVDDSNDHGGDRVVIGRLIDGCGDHDEPSLQGRVREFPPIFAFGELISAIDEFLSAKAA